MHYRPVSTGALLPYPMHRRWSNCAGHMPMTFDLVGGRLVAAEVDVMFPPVIKAVHPRMAA